MPLTLLAVARSLAAAERALSDAPALDLTAAEIAALRRQLEALEWLLTEIDRILGA